MSRDISLICSATVVPHSVESGVVLSNVAVVWGVQYVGDTYQCCRNVITYQFGPLFFLSILQKICCTKYFSPFYRKYVVQNMPNTVNAQVKVSDRVIMFTSKTWTTLLWNFNHHCAMKALLVTRGKVSCPYGIIEYRHKSGSIRACMYKKKKEVQLYLTILWSIQDGYRLLLHTLGSPFHLRKTCHFCKLSFIRPRQPSWICIWCDNSITSCMLKLKYIYCPIKRTTETI